MLVRNDRRGGARSGEARELVPYTTAGKSYASDVDRTVSLSCSPPPRNARANQCLRAAAQRDVRGRDPPPFPRAKCSPYRHPWHGSAAAATLLGHEPNRHGVMNTRAEGHQVFVIC